MAGNRMQCKLQTMISCHGMTKLVKVHRKDQSVNKNAYFYYFGQCRVITNCMVWCIMRGFYSKEDTMAHAYRLMVIS